MAAWALRRVGEGGRRLGCGAENLGSSLLAWSPRGLSLPGLLPLPPQELWRSSFLHHSNRCSCFHWPGASLMLLAVLLLLGCYGGQPAGRYAVRGPGRGSFPPLPAQGLDLSPSCLHTRLGHPGERGAAPRVSAWVA